MTLVLNEIHLLNGLEKTFLVAAADRRISKPDGSYDSTRRKLFPIPYLNPAVSHFGLAMVFPQNRPVYLSEWLPNFIRRHYGVGSLGCFAETLRQELTGIIPTSVLRSIPSGFHICGYDSRGYPDFWYFSNIGGLETFRYTDLRPQYDPPGSHFLDRDLIGVFGWDGEDPHSAACGIQCYRNGDFRAHVVAWEALDEILAKLMQFPDFERPRSLDEYGEYVKFKFEVIAYLYAKWAKKKIIARPIDVLVLEKGDS